MQQSIINAALVALAARGVAAHATFQDMWIGGVDYGSSCARLPLSNSPVTDVTSDDLACNAGTSPVSGKCSITAGSTITVEMHQQPGDRSCSEEAIGGAHYGPVLVYMSSVSDASTAVGADGAWFKIFQDTWASAGSSGSDDDWGTKDLNTCCGKMDVLIPEDLAPGDYLLRAEAIALHAAGSEGGAQMYMTCYQITVSGSGAATPDTVSIPGMYNATDPGILINIYQSMTTYDAPGPTVYSAGTTKSAGAACTACESTCSVGSTTASAGTAAAATSAAAASVATTSASAAAATTTTAAASAASSSAAASSSVQATSLASSSSSAQASSAAASSSQAVTSQAATTTVATSSAAVEVASSTSAQASATTSVSSCKRRRNAKRRLEAQAL
ncbi:glycosyl hydrolase family 61-domain-containing protein [Xylariales sp. PMI_506]|nr:glycosyl hydrolase family 61-domain-containing protein [Xylariales sp. PMI_506]